MARTIRSILGRNAPKVNWFDPQQARSGMDTPYDNWMVGGSDKPAGTTNYYEQYSGQEGVSRTSTDRGKLVRPELPPLREPGMVGRALNRMIGPDAPYQVARKPNRADRKTYQRNVKTYEQLRDKSMEQAPY